jgi:uncharacterized membrane protein
MKPVLVLSSIIALVMLAADSLMIPLVMRPLFLSRLGPQMLDELRLFPAALFYLIHIVGLIHLAGVPALRAGKTVIAAINGAMVGLVAYGCYEMTSWTIMRNWDATLVIVDLSWGIVISAFAAWLGATAALRIAKS